MNLLAGPLPGPGYLGRLGHESLQGGQNLRFSQGLVAGTVGRMKEKGGEKKLCWATHNQQKRGRDKGLLNVLYKNLNKGRKDPGILPLTGKPASLGYNRAVNNKKGHQLSSKRRGGNRLPSRLFRKIGPAWGAKTIK